MVVVVGWPSCLGGYCFGWLGGSMSGAAAGALYVCVCVEGGSVAVADGGWKMRMHTKRWSGGCGGIVRGC